MIAAREGEVGRVRRDVGGRDLVRWWIVKGGWLALPGRCALEVSLG